jgi:uncharacterized protein YjiS (DUF1127 family)
MSAILHDGHFAAPDHSRILAVLAAPFQRFVQWRRRRQAMADLSHFSDAMLEDIGITRDGIPNAVLNGRDEHLNAAPNEGAFR